MRVLFLIDSLRCGGKERQLAELATGLVRTGRLEARDVAVFSMGPPAHFDGELEQAGIRVHHRIRRSRWDPFTVRDLKKVVADFRPDILHSFSLIASFYAAVARRPHGSRFLDGSIRDALPLRGAKFRFLHGLAFRRADLVLANSASGLEAKKAPANKAAVLHNVFDFRRIENLTTPGDVRKVLSIPDGPVVGMVAGFSEFKDWDTFFEAAGAVGKRLPTVRFVAVGGGENLPKYQARYGKSSNVLFTGPRNDVEDVVQLFDVGVLCTRIEGFPNAVMEYMALGKPVVATDGGGTRELVEEGQTGFLVREARPDLVAEKILHFLENPDLAKAMGERGRRRIEEQFTLEAGLSRLMEVYGCLLSGTPPAGLESLRVRH